MADKEYYHFWLKLKKLLKYNIEEDINLQELASKFEGLKPQNVAVEIVARVYCKYCEIYNKLCECYDQMNQVQRRPYIRTLIDAITCRILELKDILQEVESFEYTYTENALQQMFMIPEDIKILCPFFCPFEMRESENQYIIDQIMEGNRIGDPTPIPSETEYKEEENNIHTEQDNDDKHELSVDNEIVESNPIFPSEKVEIIDPLVIHVLNIQRMERSRIVIKQKTHKFNKDANVYLELAGLKAPAPREDLKLKATILIQSVCRKFMQFKREKHRENKLREKLGMTIPSFIPPSLKINYEIVKDIRRKFRNNYYQKWINENIKENSRIMRIRKDDIMEDISSEIRQWFQEWYKSVGFFDEYPWPDEGGSILIVRGETFTIDEYKEWQELEIKRLKAESSNPKTKEQIKAEKLAAKQEKMRLEADALEKERKRIEDYKKQRLNPDNDPGVYINVGKCLEPVNEAWRKYECQWNVIDNKDPELNVIRGYIMNLVTEMAYENAQFELRPIVDEMMRLELIRLKNALKVDYERAGILKLPLIRKRLKPKKNKPPKPDKMTPAFMFQQLVDEDIIRKYPNFTLEDYWGDKNYAAADMRSIPWTPAFPPPCIGDIQELIRLRCILPLCANCTNSKKSHLIVGAKSYGKRSLVYAIATETNSILIDLSPKNIYNKFPGPKNLKTLLQIVNRISSIMQPSIILIENVEQTFYKKVPKEEKKFDPTRLQKELFKSLIKIIPPNDKVLVIGTASEPWLAKKGPFQKAFPSVIMLPRSDYSSISCILTKMIMKYHGVKRDFDVHSLAQTLRGYDIKTIKDAVYKLLSADRQASVWHIPLKPEEVLATVLSMKDSVYISQDDYEMFKTWYLSFSPWGEKEEYLKIMYNTQLEYKKKKDKKKKKK